MNRNRYQIEQNIEPENNIQNALKNLIEMQSEQQQIEELEKQQTVGQQQSIKAKTEKLINQKKLNFRNKQQQFEDKLKTFHSQAYYSDLKVLIQKFNALNHQKELEYFQTLKQKIQTMEIEQEKIMKRKQFIFDKDFMQNTNIKIGLLERADQQITEFHNSTQDNKNVGWEPNKKYDEILKEIKTNKKHKRNLTWNLHQDIVNDGDLFYNYIEEQLDDFDQQQIKKKQQNENHAQILKKYQVQLQYQIEQNEQEKQQMEKQMKQYIFEKDDQQQENNQDNKSAEQIQKNYQNKMNQINKSLKKMSQTTYKNKWMSTQLKQKAEKEQQLLKMQQELSKNRVLFQQTLFKTHKYNQQNNIQSKVKSTNQIQNPAIEANNSKEGVVNTLNFAQNKTQTQLIENKVKQYAFNTFYKNQRNSLDNLNIQRRGAHQLNLAGGLEFLKNSSRKINSESQSEAEDSEDLKKKYAWYLGGNKVINPPNPNKKGSNEISEDKKIQLFTPQQILQQQKMKAIMIFKEVENQRKMAQFSKPHFQQSLQMLSDMNENYRIKYNEKNEEEYKQFEYLKDDDDKGKFALLKSQVMANHRMQKNFYKKKGH